MHFDDIPALRRIAMGTQMKCGIFVSNIPGEKIMASKGPLSGGGVTTDTPDSVGERKRF